MQQPGLLVSLFLSVPAVRLRDRAQPSAASPRGQIPDLPAPQRLARGGCGWQFRAASEREWKERAEPQSHAPPQGERPAATEAAGPERGYRELHPLQR
jgi:hypothetical protein